MQNQNATNCIYLFCSSIIFWSWNIFTSELFLIFQYFHNSDNLITILNFADVGNLFYKTCYKDSVFQISRPFKVFCCTIEWIPQRFQICLLTSDIYNIFYSFPLILRCPTRKYCLNPWFFNVPLELAVSWTVILTRFNRIISHDPFHNLFINFFNVYIFQHSLKR
jgi:hypothetical protein